MSRQHQEPPLTEFPNVREHGLTLIELLIVVALSGILSGIAWPAFSTKLEKTRASSTIRALHVTLVHARSTAITRRQRVSVCGANGDFCNESGNWAEGWLSFEDRNANGRRESEETVLWRFANSANSASIEFKGGASDNRFVRFQPRGSVWPNGTFHVCVNGKNHGRVVIYRSGRARIAATGAADCLTASN